MLEVFKWLVFVAATFFTSFGLFAYFKNKKALSNRLFGLLSFVFAMWSFFWFAMLSVEQDSVWALVWAQLLNIGATLIPVVYMHWIISFFDLAKKRKIVLALGYLITLFFLAFGLSPLYVKGTHSAYFFPFWPTAGPMYKWFLVFGYALMAGYGLFLLIKNYFRSSGERKYQILYIFIGSVLGFGGGMTNFTQMYELNFFPFGIVFAGVVCVVLCPIILSYAVVAYRLMDLKVVLRGSFVYLVSVLAIFLPSGLVLYFADKLYPNYVIYASLGLLIISVSVFSPIRNVIYRLANKHFFSSLYDSSELIRNFSTRLSSTLEIDKVYGCISDTIKNSMHAKAVAVIKANFETIQYEVKYNNGFNIGKQVKFPGNEELCHKFTSIGMIIVVEELKAAYYQEYKYIIDMMDEVGIALTVPMNLKDEMVGLLVLGYKESGDMYNQEDLKTLTVIGSQSAMAIKNAQLYEESKLFTLKLQDEVERQTKELKQANEDLKKLDKAKSDFISIASHQLRTPLTAIKGFSSMILEGSYGRVSSTLKDKVQKIFESAERLVRLVNDLLDLTHIEGGKIQFQFEKTDIGKMIQGVVDELSIQADRKGLKLSFTDPGNVFVWADESKLRQVLMNLIDNAVKYSFKGSVTVSLEQKDNQINVAVKDTGIGMSLEEMDSLFQKFVRSPKATHLHTEGSGIGLYVAKKLIEEHQGTIWGESRGEGEGSTFHVSLPEYNEKVAQTVQVA